MGFYRSLRAPALACALLGPVTNAAQAAEVKLLPPEIVAATSEQQVPAGKYQKDGPWTLGFSWPGTGNTWIVQTIQEIKYTAGQNKNIADFRFVYANWKPAKQAADIEDLLANKIDTLIVQPIADQTEKTQVDAGVLALNPAPEFIPGIGSDIKAPGVEELAYDQVPVVCMREVIVLTALARDLAHNIACPMLVLHRREDHVVPPVNATILASLVASNDIRMRWLDNSYHVATLDNDKDLIVDSVGKFFTDIADC